MVCNNLIADHFKFAIRAYIFFKDNEQTKFVKTIKSNWLNLAKDTRESLKANNLPSFGIRLASPNDLCSNIDFEDSNRFFSMENMAKYRRKAMFIVVKSRQTRKFTLISAFI